MAVDLVIGGWELAVAHAELVFIGLLVAAFLLTVFGWSRGFTVANLTAAGILLAAAAVFFQLALGGIEQLLSMLSRAILFGLVVTLLLKKFDMKVNGG